MLWELKKRHNYSNIGAVIKDVINFKEMKGSKIEYKLMTHRGQEVATFGWKGSKCQENW